MRVFSGHVLPRNALNFTCSHRDLKNFPLLTGVATAGKGRGLKGSSYLKKKGRERRVKTRKVRGGEKGRKGEKKRPGKI